jgi:hypothetical protein
MFSFSIIQLKLKHFSGRDATIAGTEGEPTNQLSYQTGRVPLARAVDFDQVKILRFMY